MFRLVMTCGACPEQYDVFDGERLVGYLRLRHGWFRADIKVAEGGFDVGDTVYESRTRGDGIFEDDERDVHLTAACVALRSALSHEHHVLYVVENKIEIEE